MVQISRVILAKLPELNGLAGLDTSLDSTTSGGAGHVHMPILCFVCLLCGCLVCCFCFAFGLLLFLLFGFCIFATAL